MSARPSQSEQNQLDKSKKLIYGTIENQDIQDIMAPEGYTSEEMQGGVLLHTKCEGFFSGKYVVRGAKSGASDEEDSAEAIVRGNYQSLKTTCLDNLQKPHWVTLRIIGETPSKEVDFQASAKTLYTNILLGEEIKAILKKKGYPEARLLAEQNTLLAYLGLGVKQAGAKGTSENYTKQKDAAFAELKNWCAKYTRKVRSALKGQPQLAEKLGITIHSGLTAAQIAGKKKAAATRAAKKKL